MARLIQTMRNQIISYFLVHKHNLQWPVMNELTEFLVTQGAAFWRKDYDLAMRIWCFEEESGWILLEEDPTMIWEVAKGTQIPRDLRLVEHLDAPQGMHKFTLQPSTSMPFTGKSFDARVLLRD